MAQARRTRQVAAAEVLHQATARNFDGGWDVVDSDLNLTSRFAKVLKNFYRAQDGSLKLRYGTQLFADFSGILSTIVNMTYYGTFLIAVDDRGVIGASDGTGRTYLLFNSLIASKLPNSPRAWGPTSFVSFAQHTGQLTIHNGLDKPLLVQSNLYVRYLQDLGTGSNVNVPIGKYATTHAGYLIIAGLPLRPSVLCISAKNTSGTFFNDPPPNDAIEYDLGPRLNLTDVTITGIGSFRDKLIVTFTEAVVVITLGIYDNSGNHTPSLDDIIPTFGSVSHRSIQPLGNDMQYMDLVGVASIKRALIIGTITPSRESQLIDPEIQSSLTPLTVAALQDRTFSVYHRSLNQVMYFVPNGSADKDTTETRCFCYTFIRDLSVKAWSELRGWNWRSGCRSLEDRMFFSMGPRVFLHGDNRDPLLADLIGYAETFSDGLGFTDGTGLTPVADVLGVGNTATQGGLPISFDWTFPVSDMKQRGNIKRSKFVGLDVQGDGRFTLQMYVDNIFNDRAYLGEAWSDGTKFADGYGFNADNEEQKRPALSMDFLGGDAVGFGGARFGDDEFGGGRITSDERLYKFKAKYKLFRYRIVGSTMKALRFVSITNYYQMGSIRRG